MKVFFSKVNENYKDSIAVSNVIDFWTNLVCRPIASVIVIIINPTKISPNFVTCLSLLINLFANFNLISGSLGLAALLYFISQVLDCVDGQLARLRNGGSKLGMFLDPVFDGLKDIFTFLFFIAYFSGTYLFYFSLIGMFNVSASIIFDWVRHTIQNRPKDIRAIQRSVLKKLGIVFWSAPTRNFIIVFCLLIGLPAGVMYYVCSLGTYFTIKKGWELIDILREG